MPGTAPALSLPLWVSHHIPRKVGQSGPLPPRVSFRLGGVLLPLWEAPPRVEPGFPPESLPRCP